MSNLIRFRVRPVYHGTDLLVEIMGDHRREAFPNVPSLLRDALQSTREPHPEGLDRPDISMLQDNFITYWSYGGGHYEIDDDFGGLFVTAKENNEAVIAEVARALEETRLFVKEPVDFKQFR